MIRSEYKKRMEALVEYMVENEISPAVSFAVITKTDSFVTYAGYKQIIPEKIENEANTIYDLASISKVLVTTTLILKLMEEGQLSLKKKVKDILPEFAYSDITIKHLITHTAGFPADLVDYKKLSKDEMIAAIYHVPLEYETGTKVVYSDLGFILLGLVITKIKGSLETYAQEALFTPLKMKDTGYNPSNEVISRIASTEDSKERGLICGCVHDGKAFKLEGVSGNAGVFSTISDISNFVKMLLQDGVFEGKQILHSETIALMTTVQTEGLNEKRALGWILSDFSYPLGDYASDKTIFHTGFTGPSILVDFEKGIGVVVLANRVHPSRENKKIFEFRNQIHNLGLLAGLDN